MKTLQRIALGIAGVLALALAQGQPGNEAMVSGFRFVLGGCTTNKDLVVCQLTVTNTRSGNRDLGLYRPLNALDSATFGQLYDADGMPHRLSGAGFGNLEGGVFLSLPSGVPTKFEIAYQAKPKGKEIPLLSFFTNVGEIKFKQVVLQ